MFGRVMRTINNYFHQNDDIWYNIDGIKLHLGRGHKLPSYQKAFFFYDRFLPFFVKQMSPRGGLWSTWVPMLAIRLHLL